MAIWMEVSKDKYEFPVVMANSQSELARKLGVPVNNIASAISKSKKKGYFCKYVKVEEDE